MVYSRPAFSSPALFNQFSVRSSSLGARTADAGLGAQRSATVVPARRVVQASLQSPIKVPVEGNTFDNIMYAPSVQEGTHVKLMPEYEEDVYNYHMNVVGGNFIGAMDYGGLTFYLYQLHLHNPSENYLGEKQFPLEMHLVHRAANNISVLAIFFELGAENNQLETILNAMEQGTNVEVDVRKMLGGTIDKKKLVTFLGSLTTCPYSTGVQWVVSENVLTASQAQIDKYKALKKVRTPNNRPTKNIDHRPITKYIER